MIILCPQSYVHKSTKPIENNQYCRQLYYKVVIDEASDGLRLHCFWLYSEMKQANRESTLDHELREQEVAVIL